MPKGLLEVFETDRIPRLRVLCGTSYNRIKSLQPGFEL